MEIYNIARALLMFILARENSIANEYLIQVRDKHIQSDRMKFRTNVERLGSLLAYEISRSLKFSEQTIETPLGVKTQHALVNYPNLICVLRAGLPFFQGFLNIFDRSDCGFIGSYRASEGSKEQIEIASTYFTPPILDNKDLIIVDPMLATGKSFVKAVENILRNNNPKSIHLASLVASEEGIEYIKSHVDAKIWTIDVDKELNEHAYIVPGLGDAGDLSYGVKV